MKTRLSITTILLLIFSLLMSNCGPGQLFGPTLTPTSTVTLTPSATPTLPPTQTPTATLTYTPSPVPTMTPIPIVYDGTWQGSSKFGTPLSFEIKDNMIIWTRVKFGIQYCFWWDPANRKPENPVRIEQDAFVVENETYTLSGAFTSSTTVSGSLKSIFATCQGETTWKATRR